MLTTPRSLLAKQRRHHLSLLFGKRGFAEAGGHGVFVGKLPLCRYRLPFFELGSFALFELGGGLQGGLFAGGHGGKYGLNGRMGFQVARIVCEAT